MAAAVTCPDASEYGGDVCFNKKLSPLGGQRLTRLGLEAPPLGRDRVILVAIVAGIGAARRAAELLQLEVATYAVSEIKRSALAVLKNAWAEVVVWHAVTAIIMKEINALLLEAPRATHVLVGGGPALPRIHCGKRGQTEPR